MNNKNKIISLKEKLDDIYNTVDLTTTCNHTLKCCNAGCPQMHYSEFSCLISEIWNSTSKSEKIEMICKSIEYFFKSLIEKWGLEIFNKPCMLLDNNKKICKWYEFRPLNCRLYGLWPNDVYEERVKKFESAYKDFGIKIEQIPLCNQCSNVKRTNEEKEINIDIINEMFNKIENIDKLAGKFSDVQIKTKENYRTFHDWLLLKIFGEDWLVSLTNFMIAADKKIIEEQINLFKKAVREKFAKDMPEIEFE